MTFVYQTLGLCSASVSLLKTSLVIPRIVLSAPPSVIFYMLVQIFIIEYHIIL